MVSRKMFLVALAFAVGCGGTSEAPAEPSCDPGSVDVMIVLAPPDHEYPGCVEMPAHGYYGNTTSRQWCCWKVER